MLMLTLGGFIVLHLALLLLTSAMPSQLLAVEFVHHPSGFTVYTTCLVPLDKNPGLSPIGVGEVLRTIVGRAVMRIAKQDLHHAVGSSQICTDQIGDFVRLLYSNEAYF